MNRDDLRRKYLDEGWPQRLSGRQCVPRQVSQYKTHTIWWDGEHVLAEIREYQNPGEGGYRLIVCQLRDGDILWYDPMANPQIPQ